MPLNELPSEAKPAQTPPVPNLDDIAARLARRLVACDDLVELCFDYASQPEMYRDAREAFVKMGVKLLQTNANVAVALKRMQQTPQQNIVVTHAAK